MPTWAKVLLVVLVVAIGLGGVALFFGIRWARREFQEIKNDGPRLVAEAKEFGRDKEGEAVVVESLARLSRCDGFICEAKVKLFLTTALTTANVSEGFCKGVPRRGEILATVTWAQAECAHRGFPGSQPCGRLITGIQDRCSK